MRSPSPESNSVLREGESADREPTSRTMGESRPAKATKEDRVQELEELFRIRQQLEMQRAGSMFDKTPEEANRLDEVVYEMLRAIKTKYDTTPNISAEERTVDIAALVDMRNGLTATFRGLEEVRKNVAQGIDDLREFEANRKAIAEHQKREKEEKSLLFQLKSFFAPKEPTPIAVSKKVGKKVELVRLDPESEDHLARLKKRHEELSDVMREVEDGISFLRAKK